MSESLTSVQMSNDPSGRNVPNSSRPKSAVVSAITAGTNADSSPAASKRQSVYPVPRKGLRKKTLSLNPEEREALENLIEEVIMGGVGEGVIDSNGSSSDDDEDDEDYDEEGADVDSAHKSPHLTDGVSGDAFKRETLSKGTKKFYPGQLKVALKHMHDLPPRFVRKLAKAQQYLDAGGNMYSRPSTVGRIDEEDEAHTKDDSKQTGSTERDKERAKVKETKLKEAKKAIRSLLTDRDQYVDETVVSSVVATPVSLSSPVTDTCAPCVTDGSRAHNILTYSPNKTVQSISDPVRLSTASSVVPVVGEVPAGASITNKTAFPPIGIDTISVSVAEFIPQTARRITEFRSSPSVVASVPVLGAGQMYAPEPGMASTPYQYPVVHAMTPLGQSPPGTQMWIPQAVVSGNAPGYYGSSPPVVGMSSAVPGTASQHVSYGYSVQTAYPQVANVPSSYPPPQYSCMYSATPSLQPVVTPQYSIQRYSQPASYSLTVLCQDPQYIHNSTVDRTAVPVVPASYYQNTPPPGYPSLYTHSMHDQKSQFTGTVSHSGRKLAGARLQSGNALSSTLSPSPRAFAGTGPSPRSSSSSGMRSLTGRHGNLSHQVEQRKPTPTSTITTEHRQFPVSNRNVETFSKSSSLYPSGSDYRSVHSNPETGAVSQSSYSPAGTNCVCSVTSTSPVVSSVASPYNADVPNESFSPSLMVTAVSNYHNCPAQNTYSESVPCCELKCDGTDITSSKLLTDNNNVELACKKQITPPSNDDDGKVSDKDLLSAMTVGEIQTRVEPPGTQISPVPVSVELSTSVSDAATVTEADISLYTSAAERTLDREKLCLAVTLSPSTADALVNMFGPLKQCHDSACGEDPKYPAQILLTRHAAEQLYVCLQNSVSSRCAVNQCD